MEENKVSPLVEQDKESPLVTNNSTPVVDKASKNYAFLASLAKLPNVQTQDPVSALKQLQTENEAKLSQGGKTVIETEVRATEMQREVGVAKQASTDPFVTSEYLANAFKRITGTSYPVEAAAAETMVLAGSLDEQAEQDEESAWLDPVLAQIAGPYNSQTQADFVDPYPDILPSVYEKQIELATKRSILFQESFNQAQELGLDMVGEREGLEHFITMFEFLPMIVPIINTIPMSGNVPGKEENFGDNLLPGVQVRKESKYLMDLPMDEFEKVAPEAVARTYRNTLSAFAAPGGNFHPYYNKLAQELLVNQFIDPASAAEINTFAIADISGVLFPAVRLGAKGITSLEVLKGFGANRTAAKLAAEILHQSSEVGLAKAAENAATTADEALSASLVKAVDIEESIVSGVSSADEVNDILATTDDLLSEGNVTRLMDLNRLKPEELTKAIENTVKKAEKRLGRKIKPADVHSYNATPGTGIYTPAIRVLVGTSKGTEFKSLKALYKYANQIGLSGFKVKYIDRAVETIEPPAFGRMPPQFDEILVEFPKTLNKVIKSRKAAGNTTKPTVYVPKTDETPQQSFEEIVKYAQSTNETLQVLVTRDGNLIAGSAKDFPEGFANAVGLSDDVGIGIVAPKSKYKDLNDFYRSVRTKDNTKFSLKDEGEPRVPTNVEGVTASAVRDETTRGYYLVFERGVDEQGFFEAIRPTSFLGLPEMGFGWLFAGGRLIEEKWLYGFASLSESRRNSLVKLIKERYVPTLQKLDKKERQLLTNVVRVEDRQERWMTDIELRDHYTHEFGVGSNADDFVNAHKAFRELNDIEWRLRNDALYSELSTSGHTTVGLKETAIGDYAPKTAKLETDISKVRPGSDEPVFNAADGQVYRWADLDKDMLKEQKFAVVRYKDVQSFGDSNHVARYVVVPLSNVEETPLSRIQLGYREGGHRIYSPDVRYWIKGARSVTDAFGKTRLMNPITMYGGLTHEELKQLVVDLNAYVKLAEQRLDAIRAGKPRSGLVDLIRARQNNPVLPAVEDMLKMVEEGKASSATPFEIVEDRAFPSQYKVKSEAQPFVDNPGEPVYEHMRDVGRLYYSERGDEIKIDYRGKELPVLDVYEALAQSVNNITNTVAFGPYKISKMERWVEAYGDILELKPNMSLSQKFNAPIRADAPWNLRMNALKQRSVTRRLLNWTPPQGRHLNNIWNSLLDVIEFGTVGIDRKRDALRKSRKFGQIFGINKGINFLKGAAFDLKLGFLNVAQVPLQLASTLSVLGIDASKTTNALALYSFVRTFRPGQDDAAFLRMFGTQAGRLYSGFDDPTELLGMVKGLKEQSGFSIVNRTYAALDDLEEESLFNGVAGLKSATDQVMEFSRVFFYESEKINKSVAYMVAWKMVREEFPELAWNSQEFAMKVNGKASTLAFGMDNASSAAFQKGQVSLATQFMSYPIRSLEMMLGQELTYQQKLRYFLGQALMFGAAGPPIVGFLEDQWNKVQGPQNYENAPIETAFERGAIDTLLYYGTGADVLYGERAGSGRWLEDVIREAVGMSRYGHVTPAEMAGGASFSVVWDAASGIGEFTQDLARLALSKELPAEERLKILTTNMSENARVISTWNNATKFLSAQEAQLIYSRQTNPIFGPSKASTVLATDLTPFEAVLTGLFGLSPGEQREISTYVALNKDYKNAISDYANEIKAAELAYTRAELAGDVNAKRDALALRNSLYQLVPAGMYTEVMDEVNQYDHTKEISENLRKIYEKRQLQEEYRKDIERKMKDGE